MGSRCVLPLNRGELFSTVGHQMCYTPGLQESRQSPTSSPVLSAHSKGNCIAWQDCVDQNEKRRPGVLVKPRVLTGRGSPLDCRSMLLRLIASSAGGGRTAGGRERAVRMTGWRGVCVLLNGNPGGRKRATFSSRLARLACLVRSSSLFGHTYPLSSFHSRHIYIAFSLPPFTRS